MYKCKINTHLLWIIPLSILLLIYMAYSYNDKHIATDDFRNDMALKKLPPYSNYLPSDTNDLSSNTDGSSSNTNNLEKNTGLRKESGVFLKGSPPLSKAWIVSQLKPFLYVYNTRPSIDNMGGSKVMHQFALWCMIKHLNPKHIIESGIYLGLGTWILRQAAPNAQIILLDPNGKAGSVYKDTHKDTIYMIGGKFQDFKSVKWSEILDPDETLVFIDDHQYPIRRLQEALQFGFKHIMFDDNYYEGGDVMSLKKLLAMINKDLPTTSFKVLENNKKVTDVNAVLSEAKDLFDNNIDTYWEFPQMWFCHVGKCNTNSDSVNFLLNNTDGEAVLKEYGLTKLPPKIQINGYYNIVYVKLQYNTNK